MRVSHAARSGAGARARDEDFENGVGEDGGERKDAVDAAGVRRRDKRRVLASVGDGFSECAFVGVKAKETLR